MLTIESVNRSTIHLDRSVFTVRGRHDGSPFTVRVLRPVKEDAIRLFLAAESCTHPRAIRALTKEDEI